MKGNSSEERRKAALEHAKKRAEADRISRELEGGRSAMDIEYERR